MRRITRLLLLVIQRLFWIAVCVWSLIFLFTSVYPITDGFGRMGLDFMAILLIFTIFRLATAKPNGARS